MTPRANTLLDKVMKIPLVVNIISARQGLKLTGFETVKCFDKSRSLKEMEYLTNSLQYSFFGGGGCLIYNKKYF